MRTPLACIVLAVALIGCSSKPERSPHATVGILDLQQPKRGWNPFAHKPQRDLVVKAVDGQAVRDQRARSGLVLTPGWHSITLSAKRNSGASLGVRYGGESGRKLGERMDDRASAAHDRVLQMRVIAGHDYTAHMKQRGDHYEYWIEDRDGKIIVGGKRR